MTLENSKLLSLPDAVIVREKLKSERKKFVLTNGCFDLLHPGHVACLEEAKSKGDVLWVAINSDSSVQELKGPTRPIFSEEERAYVLAALEVVDGITIFDSERLTNEILALKPDIYVKAGDYSLDTLNSSERQALEQVGAKIQFLSFIQGFSTSSIIEKIGSLEASSL